MMNLEDLISHSTTFSRPISTTYRGYNVFEVPPPTQVQMMLLLWLFTLPYRTSRSLADQGRGP